MINLILTDKEAVAVHMVYYVGAMLVAGDHATNILAVNDNVCHCLAENFSAEERDALKRKMSILGRAVNQETLREMRVKLFE